MTQPKTQVTDADVIDQMILAQLIRASVAYMRKTYPTD